MRLDKDDEIIERNENNNSRAIELPYVSVEIADAPGAETLYERVRLWTRKNSRLIEEEAARRNIDPRAIAGAIAWEALDNPIEVQEQGPIYFDRCVCNILGVVPPLASFQGPACYGPGKIHYWNLDASFGATVATEVEALNLVSHRSDCARGQYLLGPNGAVEYIAAIMGAFADVYDPYFNIRNQPEILMHLYQGVDGGIRGRTEFLKKQPHGYVPQVQCSTVGRSGLCMGQWYLTNSQYVGTLLGGRIGPRLARRLPAPRTVTWTTSQNTPARIPFDILVEDGVVLGVLQGTNGSVDLVGENVIYVPNEGFVGVDSFLYSVNAHEEVGLAGEVAIQVQGETCTAPVAPSDPAVSAVTPTSVVIHWRDTSNNETAFRVAKLDEGEDPNNFDAWDNVCVTGPNATSCRVDDLASGRMYSFRIRAANDCGTEPDVYSAFTNVIQVTTTLSCAAPAAPSDPSVSDVTPSSVVIHWRDNSTNETAFRVAILDEGEDPNNFDAWDNVCVTGPNATGCRVEALCPNRTYWLKLRAAAECGGNTLYSPYSSNVQAVTSSLPPPFECVAARQSSTPAADPVLVTWRYQGVASGFRVARLDPGEDPNNAADWDNVGGDLPLGVFSYLDRSSSLINGETFRYKLRAFLDTACGRMYSEYSNIDPANP